MPAWCCVCTVPACRYPASPFALARPALLTCSDCVLGLSQVVGLHARPAFCGETLVDGDENLFEHLRVHLRHRLARPAQTVLHKFGLERSASSGRLRARKDGPWCVLAQVGARCSENPLVPVGLSVAQSLGRACLELVCAQNRFLTLGMRIGREVLLTLRVSVQLFGVSLPARRCELFISLLWYVPSYRYMELGS